MEFEVDVQIHHYDNTPTNADIPALLNNKGMCYPKENAIKILLFSYVKSSVCLHFFFQACDDLNDNSSQENNSDLESLYPSVPLRTSSILPRPVIGKYICLKKLGTVHTKKVSQ